MCKSLSYLGRVIIGILSLIFTIIGVGLLIVGILVKTNASVITDQLKPLLDSVVKQATASNPAVTSLNLAGFDINEIVGSLAYVFIGLGVVMAVIGVLGLVGSCCQVKCMLILYMVIIIILLTGVVVLVVIIAGDRTIITDLPKKGLKEAFKNDYGGITAVDATSLIWNLVMTELKCCGIDGESDILTAPKWIVNERQGGVVHPIACCKSDKITGTPPSCAATSATSDNSNKDIPCYDKLWDFILKGIPFILGACGAIGFLTILAIFSYIILREIDNKNKVGPQ